MSWKGRTARSARVNAVRRAVCRAACSAAVVSAVVTAVASGVAAQAPDGDPHGWEPTLSVGFDVQNQGFETDVDSSLGVSGSESNTVISSLFRFDTALYTPTLVEPGGAPRLLIHAGAQIPLSAEHALLRLNREFLVGGPDTGQSCPIGGAVLACDHAGTTDLIYDLNWYAGLGVEFTLPLGRRQFKLRPSVDYFGQSLGFEGSVARVDRNFQGGVVDRFSVSASTSEIVHAVGPRITFDVETARVGAFSFNVFLETQLYWILSERDIYFGGQNADGTADFHVKLRPLIAQGGAGLRVVWHGD